MPHYKISDLLKENHIQKFWIIAVEMDGVLFIPEEKETPRYYDLQSLSDALDEAAKEIPGRRFIALQTYGEATGIEKVDVNRFMY